MICKVLDVKIPSMAFFPLLQVWRGVVSECRVEMHSLSPSDVSLVAAVLLWTSSFKSIITMICSPRSIHCWIAVTKSSIICVLGQLSIFLASMILLCCLYVDFRPLLMHGLYAVIIRVLTSLFPDSSVQHHRPIFESSLPCLITLNTGSPRMMFMVPPG